MEQLFMNYILPFLMLVSIVGYAALRVQWLGGPGMLVVVFFTLLFGPSLLYAIVTDESSGTLFLGSLIVALVTVAVLGVLKYRASMAK